MGSDTCQCLCCCSNCHWAKWRLIKRVLYISALLLFLCGIIVTIVAGGIGSDPWLADLITDLGFGDQPAVILGWLYYVLKVICLTLGLAYLVWGACGCLAVRCKKCCCTCCYGFILWSLTVWTWVVFIPALAIAHYGNQLVTAFCADKPEDFPFGMGNNLKGQIPTADSIDLLINSPAALMCSDLCPCVAIDPKLWSKEQQAAFQDTATFRFDGEATIFQTCIDSIMESTEEIQKALDRIDISNMASIDDTNTPDELKKTDTKDMNVQEIQDQIEYVLNGVMMKIYKLIEDRFGCQGFCKPGNFWMTKDITIGPPTIGCGIAANNGIVYYFGGWGTCLLLISLVMWFLLFWSCCLYRRKSKYPDQPLSDSTSEKARQEGKGG